MGAVALLPRAHLSVGERARDPTRGGTISFQRDLHLPEAPPSAGEEAAEKAESPEPAAAGEAPR